MDLVEYSVSRPAAIPAAGRMYILIVAAIRSPVAGAFVVHPGDAPRTTSEFLGGYSRAL